MPDDSQKGNRQTPEAFSGWKSQLAELDDLAANSAVRDERAATGLANAIAACFPALNQTPNSLLQHVTSRFARTEASYRKGATQGISESAFLYAFNQFMQSVSAPDYCRISRLQIAARRQMISTYIPHLAGVSAQTGSSIADSSEPSRMPPLEAEFLLLDTINFKLIVPRQFQATPEEWDSKHLSRLAGDSRSIDLKSASDRPIKRVLVGAPLESSGLYAAILLARDQLGYRKLNRLLEDSLDAMGLEP